jgi:hypothetical protein
MRPPRKPRKVRNQKLAAPDPAVGAVPRAVESDADHLAAQMVFRHATRNVRMVVLHPDLSLDSARQRHPRTHVSGMQIVGRHSRRNLEDVLHLRQRVFEEPHRLVVLQIADMLAQDRVSPLRQAEGVLQLAAESQHLLHLTP